MEDRILVVGSPIFGFTPDSYSWQPAGYEELCGRIRSSCEMVDEKTGAKTVDKLAAVNGLLADYSLLVFALGAAGRKFTILRADDELIRTPILDWLKQYTIEYTFVQDFGENCGLVVYPRDLAMVMPDGKTIYANRAEFPGRGTTTCGSWRIKRLYYGEGGTMLLRRKTAVVNTWWLDEKNKLVDPEQLVMLKQAGVEQVILLRNNLLSLTKKDGALGYVYEEHIDRYAGLLEAEDGSLHLIIDSTYPRSYEFGQENPKTRRESVIAFAKEQCDDYGVQLHILEGPLQVPLSLGFAQLHDGTIVMTRGEPQLEMLVRQLLPPEKIILVGGEKPFQHIPAFSKAGIRCLLNEFPQDFLQHIARKRDFPAGV